MANNSKDMQYETMEGDIEMRTICAWCQKVIRDGELIDGQVSHGICTDCLRLIEKECESVKVHNENVKKGKKK